MNLQKPGNRITASLQAPLCCLHSCREGKYRTIDILSLDVHVTLYVHVLGSFSFPWLRAQAPSKGRLTLFHPSVECDGGLPI